MIRIAVAFVALALLAGCGSTATRVVTKTERAAPCATPAAMEACVLAFAHEDLRLHHDVAVVKVSCEKRGDHWTCLRFVDFGAGQSSCYRLTVRRVGIGLPYFTKAAESFDCPWTA